MDILNYVKVVFGFIGAFLGLLFGQLDGFLFALIMFVILDYITGLMCAFINKNLSSEIGAKGIFKKIVIFVVVMLGHIIDSKVIGDVSVLRTTVIFFYLANEGISLLENVTIIGLPVPEKLKQVLMQIKEKDNNKD